MAIKVCPICSKEYDDALYESCPFCATQENKDAIPDDTILVETEADTPSVDFADTEFSDEAVDADTDAADGKNKMLKIVAAVLAVVLVALIAIFAYVKFIAPKKSENYIAGLIRSEVSDSVGNVKKFSEKDLDGTFSDKVNYMYYTFSHGKASIEVPTSTEEEEDPSAESSGETKTVVTSSTTVEYDGTYTRGMTQEGIRQMVIIDYIEDSGLAQDYMDYIEAKGDLSSDFEGYVKEKKLESDISKFDSENGMSQKYAFEKVEGYWNLEEGVIYLFDSNGENVGKYKVTDKGIVNVDYLYEGKLPSKGDMCAVYEMTMENYGVEQKLSIRLYRDGYCIFAVDGAQTSIQAGTYKFDDKGIYVDVNGQKIFFYVTDFGICNELLTK